MSNIAGKAYAMNVITPMSLGRLWLQRGIFMVSRCFPSTLAGLLGLKLIHFARWVLIPRDKWPNMGQAPNALKNDYMLFCSNFNGTWDQYIDAFSDGLPNGLDLYWYTSTKYPQSIPITPFKDYIVFNQFFTDYYYNATPGAAQRDVKSGILTLRKLRDLAQRHGTMTPEAFATAWAEALLALQNELGSDGLAPLASNATENADRNRLNFLANDWPGCG